MEMNKQPLPETLTNAPPPYVQGNPPAPGFCPPNPPPNQSNQPMVVVINNDQTANKCPQCGQLSAMEYQEVVSTRQHLWALCLCLTCCICAWVPYVSNECMFNRGKCKSCGYTTKDKTNNTGLKIVIVAFVILIIVVLIISLTTTREVVRYSSSVDWTNRKFEPHRF